jgi:2-iminobutanoate/2-iminopropanoate deaminase
MEKRCIHAAAAPPALGPYSHAVAAGPLLFLSGQGPMNPDGSGVQRGTLEQEIRLTFSNIQAVLEAAGSSLEDVVKVTVYLKDMEQFAAFNEVYKHYFPENCPARTTIQAGRLPLDIQIEVDVIALAPERA